MNNLLNQKLNSNAAGFTLLEATIVLAILGLVIAVIWGVSAGAFGTNSKNHLAEQVLTTVSNVRHYIGHVDFPAGSTMDTAQASNLGLLPGDVSSRAGGFFHALNGQFIVQVTVNGIYISMDNLTADSCSDLLFSRIVSNATVANDVGLLGYQIPATSSAPPIASLSTAYSFNAITTACANAPNRLVLAFSP